MPARREAPDGHGTHSSATMHAPFPSLCRGEATSSHLHTSTPDLHKISAKTPQPKEVTKSGNSYHQAYNIHDKAVALYTPTEIIYSGVNGMGQTAAPGVA